MEFRMECPKCLASITQAFKRVGKDQVLVITKCIRKGCPWQTGSIIPLKGIYVEDPSMARKIEAFGIVCKT